MDNVQNCDSYINMPSPQICRYYLDGFVSGIETKDLWGTEGML
jgi:hypothetical protein